MNQTELPPISNDERERITKSLLAETWFVCLRVLEDLVGNAVTKENLLPHLRNAGYAFVSNMKIRYGIEGNDIHTIAKITALGKKFMEFEAREIEHTEEKVVSLCTDCIYRDCSSTVCWMGHTWSNFMVEAINPGYEERLMQMVTEGDPICLWILEKKK